MRNFIICVAVFCSVNLLTLEAKGQYEAVYYEEILKSQSLSGIVQVGIERGGVPGVLVEKCSDDWTKVVSSTVTDSKGHFVFPKPSTRGIHYLRLSKPNFNPIFVKVRLDKSGPKELILFLPVAT